MILEELVRWGTEILQQNGILEASIDAKYLMEDIFSMTRSEYFLQKDKEADPQAKARYERAIEMRSKRIPLQHIVGYQEFMGMRFRVTEDVLVPRQDTECLVEYVLPYVQGKDILDLCTGSGCIGISLAKLGDCKSVTLSDRSKEALSVASQNAKELQAEVTLVESDLFDNLSSQFHIIVSNPPYIPKQEIETLMPEVRDHEPRMALDGGDDGYDFYRKIVERAAEYLFEDGRLMMEIGCDQGNEVYTIMKENGFTNIEIKKDLAGLDRVIAGKVDTKHV